MRRVFPALALMMMLATLPASATPACYSDAQFRAEQAIRFHTRLMIIGMRCQRILSPTAYMDYQEFSKRNQSVIRAQENHLLAYFKESKTPQPERALHTFRTNLANDMSMQANGPAVVQFCRGYEGLLHEAKAMKPDDFQRWITKTSVAHGVSSTRPACAASQRQR